MIWNDYIDVARHGDLVELVGASHKHFIVKLRQGEKFQSHRGIINHDELIGLPWGSLVHSHNGRPFYMMQPSLTSLLLYTPRNTQIMYPKDIGFIFMTMGIGPGQRVIEAGTGSGGLTTALAYVLGDSGKLYSYERKNETSNLAEKNLLRLGLLDRVELKKADIIDGFGERNVDALFLDVPNPYDYMEQVRQALKPGGYFGSILPTVNQVSILLKALKTNGFAFIEVCETLLRYYKPDAERLRPSDRMVAHTGFLIFARPVVKIINENENIETEDMDQME